MLGLTTFLENCFTLINVYLCCSSLLSPCVYLIEVVLVVPHGRRLVVLKISHLGRNARKSWFKGGGATPERRKGEEKLMEVVFMACFCSAALSLSSAASPDGSIIHSIQLNLWPKCFATQDNGACMKFNYPLCGFIMAHGILKTTT